MVRQGWDRPLAWATKLIRDAKQQETPITRSTLEDAAKHVEFFSGALDLEMRLKDFIRHLGNGQNAEVDVSIQVVTSGFEDLLTVSKLKDNVTEIWGSLLEIDPDTGIALGPKSAVSFTEKTRFVFAINKGIPKPDLRSVPERVNDLVPRTSRPVPFENMIYVGDGLTDIPCYSLIEQHGGAAVGIRGVEIEKPDNEPRLWNYRPRWGPFRPDYTDGSDLTKLLKDLLHDAIRRSRPG